MDWPSGRLASAGRKPRKLDAASRQARERIASRWSPMHKGPSIARAFVVQLFMSLLCGGCFDRLSLGYSPILCPHFEAGEAANGDVLAKFTNLLSNELLDRDGLLLDEGLLQQAHLLVELRHLAFDDLLDHIGRLAGGGRLRAIDLLLALHVFGSNVFGLHVAGIAGRDVHGNLFEQLLEIL